MPFLAESDGMCVMSWNILCQMKFNSIWEYFNNGFTCRDESDEEYRHRLSHIAAQLSAINEDDRRSVICLQECPETPELREQLIADITKQPAFSGYRARLFNNTEDEYYLITMYDGNMYHEDEARTNQIQAVVLKQGLVGRILPLVLVNRVSGDMTVVINVHANFSQAITQDIICLEKQIKCLGITNILLIGDFNRDLVSQSDDYSQHDVSLALDASRLFGDTLQVQASNSASFCSTYDRTTSSCGQRLETRDGVMSSFEVKLVPMYAMNAPKNALSFAHPVSKALSFIPERFCNLEVAELPDIIDVSASTLNL
tara:strand:- start:51878 stop:52819 length:942 start_codon:yes stop_codon:yes gene_type:complete